MTMNHGRFLSVLSVLLVHLSLPALLSAADQIEAEWLIERMRESYSMVEDYQTLVTVRDFREKRSVALRRFLYSFRKPKRVRMDLETPHRGAVLIYPDKKGKVLVRFRGVAGVLPFHLALDNPLVMWDGQRIDQTDMGLLIDHITHSLTDERRGDISLVEDGKYLDVQVLAINHFSKSVTSLYRFRIDKASWLPAEVDESTADGLLQKKVSFENLRVNIGVSDQFIEGG